MSCYPEKWLTSSNKKENLEKMNGEAWALHKAEDGNIMAFISKLRILIINMHACIMHEWHEFHVFLSRIFSRSFILTLILTLTYRAEPHILLFKRPLGTDPKTGQVSSELVRQHHEKA